MHIGLLKFCIPLTFNVLGSTSNDGSDDRYGFIKELLKRGHKVTIFTPLTKGTRNNPKDERMLLETDEELIPKNLRFLKQIGYMPGELPIGENKVDILVCEAGVGNFLYRNNYAKDLDGVDASLIRRFMHVIDAHKGPVFYMHNDPSLPFYFRQLAGRKYPWNHKNNGYTNPIKENRGNKWVRDSGWGTYSEIFDNKKSVILTRCVPDKFEFMIDNYNVDRAGYKEYQKELSFEYVPPAYSYELCDDLHFEKGIKYPLFYSGGDRRRRIAFRKFYEEMGVPTYVSGKWKEEAMQTFDGINFMGWLEDREALLKTVNRAGCVVQIQPKDASKMGWWTARTMEVAACKSMPFIDGSIVSGKNMVFDDWFVLKSKDEAQKKIAAFLRSSYKDRIRIIETQLAYCQTYFTWKKFTDVFITLCQKYLPEREVEHKVRKEYKDLLQVYLDKDIDWSFYNKFKDDELGKIPKIIMGFDEATEKDRSMLITIESTKSDKSNPFYEIINNATEIKDKEDGVLTKSNLKNYIQDDAQEWHGNRSKLDPKILNELMLKYILNQDEEIKKLKDKLLLKNEEELTIADDSATGYTNIETNEDKIEGT